MVNWNDPAVLTRDYLTFVKLMHTLGGLYIWEFFDNLGFEWDIYKGRRKYRWTLWLYIGCRVTALVAVICMFVGFDVTREINCTAQAVCVFLFGYLSFIFASALIVLRVAAIWEWRRPVIALAAVAWTTNAGFGVHSAAISSAVWAPELGACIILHTETTRDNIIATLVTDTILLLLILFGLLRWRRVGLGGGLWKLLFNQGLLWILVVTLAEVPSTVFILLNLNAPWNLMFQVPELIIMAIGASRIYRGLADYSSIADLQTKLPMPAMARTDKTTAPSPVLAIGNAQRSGLVFRTDSMASSVPTTSLQIRTDKAPPLQAYDMEPGGVFRVRKE